MINIATIIDTCFEKTKSTLNSGSANPVTVTFTAGNKTIVSHSSLMRNQVEMDKFVQKIRAYPANFKEIDAGFLSAIALTQKGDNSDAQNQYNTDRSVIVAYCTRAGETRAFFQPFSIIANEVFYGEKQEVAGQHNFCDFLKIAFDLKE
jgi:hypothetical protein